MQLLILTAGQAATVNESPLLAPRLIAAGPEAGAFAVNRAVLTDTAHEPYWPVLAAGRIVDLDIAAAWPLEPDA